MKFKKWRQTTLQGCKRCPQCHMYIEKNEGCMHMTCCKCRHEFCWECMSSWKGSCSAPSFYHNSARILNNDIWGQSLSTRVVSKSIGIPIICAVGCGLGGLAFGAASVAAACVIASTPIAAGVYLYNNPPRPLRKLYYRMTGEAKTSISEIRSIVQYGIIISLPWRYDDPNYIMTLRGMRSDEPAILPNSGFITNGVHNTNPTFMGIPGRICHSIFVGYMTHSSISSFVAYFIPSECPLEQIDELQLRTDDIVRIPYPSSHVPYSNYREEDGVVLQQLFHHIQIAAALA